MSDTANFTIPDTGGGGQQAQAPYWDPQKQQWVHPPAAYDPLGGSNPVDAYGNAAYSSATKDPTTTGGANVGGNYDPNTNGATAGRVVADSSATGGNTGAAWGGYTGTMVKGPDGSLHYDEGLSGRAADVSRFRGLGAAAAGRAAYQTDYSQANQDAALGASARQGQSNAMALSRDVAMGGNTASQNLARTMLQQGAQAQQAVALSARGGSLAQAAALRHQQNGQAAYMQQGNNQMRALQADEMAAGRSQYAAAAAAQRAQDATAQGLHQQQAIGQMGNELGQRDLNQQGQMGYEGMAQNVNKSAQDAALKSREIGVGIDAAASLRGQRQADRDLQTAGAVAGTAGTVVAGIGNSLGDDTSGQEPTGRRKRDDENFYSDERTKVGVRSLASAAAARKRA
jgi:hypothetical protein